MNHDVSTEICSSSICYCMRQEEMLRILQEKESVIVIFFCLKCFLKFEVHDHSGLELSAINICEDEDPMVARLQRSVIIAPRVCSCRLFCCRFMAMLVYGFLL